MALLASKRLLTKNEIFSSVAGYDGAQESMERMFERDKDDLRSLGIEIEVAPLDSLFEDELGYRITPDSYSLKIPELTPAELGLLSVAAKSWRTTVFSEGAQKALRKISSLGVDVDIQSLNTSIIPIDEGSADFELIWRAITENLLLSFVYSTNQSIERKIEPYGSTLFNGEWYLVGRDVEKDDLRTFKVKRISHLKAASKKGAFIRPHDFNLNKALVYQDVSAPLEVKLLVPVGKALALRYGGEVASFDENWDEIRKSYRYVGEAVAEILWYAPDVFVAEPLDLHEHIMSLLSSRASGVMHGK